MSERMKDHHPTASKPLEMPPSPITNLVILPNKHAGRPRLLMSYEDRMTRYRKDVRKYRRKMALFFLVSGGVSFAGVYFLPHIFGLEPFADWRTRAAIFAILLMIPPLKIFRPKKPIPSEVEYDRAMRRAAGMDDTVAPPGTYI